MAAQSCAGSSCRRFLSGPLRGVTSCSRHVALGRAASAVRTEEKWRSRQLNTSAVRGAPPVTQVLMPALSPTMEEGTIVKWLKREGDVISPGDDLCEIETDKATVTMDTEEEGILAKIIIPEGTRNVKISKPIALIVDEGEDPTKVEVPVESQAPGNEVPTTADKSQRDHTSSGALPAGLSPAVRLLLETYQLDSRLIPATGPKGRLLKGDVLRFVAQEGRPFTKPEQTHQPAASPPAVGVKTQKDPAQVLESSITSEHTDIPHTNMRRTIAKRLAESKASIPHAYSVAECQMDKLLALRAQLKQDGTVVSVNDLIIKAAALALRSVPRVNAVLKDGETQLLGSVDVSVAVATDSGLITPIVKDAAGLDVTQISSTLKDLAARAREGKLQLHEFQGGSFTISNLGMFGITEFSAVINPPQVCIMAVGGTRAVLGADEAIHKVMRVTLSCDGRVVDEQLATEWLEAFRNNIENPERLGI